MASLASFKSSINELSVPAASAAAARKLWTLLLSSSRQLERSMTSPGASKTAMIAALRSQLQLHAAAYREGLLQALADAAAKTLPTDPDTRDAYLNLVHELTLIRDMDMGELLDMDAQAYQAAQDGQVEPSELHCARLHPDFVALALTALAQVTAQAAEQAHVSVGYLVELVQVDMCYEEVRELMLDVLRSKACADAMWACLSSGSLNCLSSVSWVLKRMLGGHASAIAGGLEADDDEDGEEEGSGEEGGEERGGRRVLIREFVGLGGGAPLGRAFAAVARLTRSAPPRGREQRQAGRATASDMLSIARVSLCDCLQLMCSEGAAAGALRRRPLDWPPALLEGHVDLVLASLEHGPGPLGASVIAGMAPYAGSPAAVEALRVAALHLAPGHGGGLGRAAALMLRDVQLRDPEDTLMVGQYTATFKVLEELCSNSSSLSLHFISEGALTVLLACMRALAPPPPSRPAPPVAGAYNLDAMHRMIRESRIAPTVHALSWTKLLLSSLETAVSRQQQAGSAGSPGDAVEASLASTALAKAMPGIASGAAHVLLQSPAFQGQGKASELAAECLRLLDRIKGGGTAAPAAPQLVPLLGVEWISGQI